MTSAVLRNRRGNSFSDARAMTTSEQASMGRATAELDAELEAILREREPRFRFRDRGCAVAAAREIARR